MKYSQKKVVEFYKETAHKFNVYSFDQVTKKRVSAYMSLDFVSAFQELVNKSYNGFLVLVVDEEGEEKISKWEIKNHTFSTYDFCKQFAVKTYVASNSISRI